MSHSNSYASLGPSSLIVMKPLMKPTNAANSARSQPPGLEGSSARGIGESSHPLGVLAHNLEGGQPLIGGERRRRLPVADRDQDPAGQVAQLAGRARNPDAPVWAYLDREHRCRTR